MSLDYANKIKVGILRGGKEKYYQSSIKRGGHILNYINNYLSHKIESVDIFIDKEDIWHKGGIPIKPAELIHKVDIIWNASHPNISNTLNSLGIPNISENPFHFLLKDNRVMMKEYFKDISVNIPKHIILPAYQEDIDGEKDKYAIKKAKEVFQKFGAPYIVRSFTPDQNIGVHVANTLGELVDAIEDISSHNKSILVEELIAGKSLSVHSVAGFRNQDIYTFPILGFSKEEKEKLVNLSQIIHKYFNDFHYTKLDFILHKNKGIYLVNIDFYPDLRMDSGLAKSCESIGAKMHHIVDHLIDKALK